MQYLKDNMWSAIGAAILVCSIFGLALLMNAYPTRHQQEWNKKW